MKVKIHKLFELLLQTTAAEPEAALGFSLAAPPRLGDFLDELDPELPLDWSNQSFQGRTALRERIIARTNLSGACTAYWSANERTDNNLFAWYVGYENGRVSSSVAEAGYYVRCVDVGP